MMRRAQSEQLRQIRLFRHENAEKIMVRAKTVCAAAEREAHRALEERRRFDAHRREETDRIYGRIMRRKIAPSELDEARDKEARLKERLALLEKEALEKKREAETRRKDYEDALRALHQAMRGLDKADKIVEDARKAERAAEAAREDDQIDEFAERMVYARG